MRAVTQFVCKAKKRNQNIVCCLMRHHSLRLYFIFLLMWVIATKVGLVFERHAFFKEQTIYSSNYVWEATFLVKYANDPLLLNRLQLEGRYDPVLDRVLRVENAIQFVMILILITFFIYIKHPQTSALHHEYLTLSILRL